MLSAQAIETVREALELARFSAEYDEAIHDDDGNFVALGNMAKVTRIDAALAELEQGETWTPVNPVSMANDEYADAEIMLCYRTRTASAEQEER